MRNSAYSGLPLVVRVRPVGGGNSSTARRFRPRNRRPGRPTRARLAIYSGTTMRARSVARPRPNTSGSARLSAVSEPAAARRGARYGPAAFAPGTVRALAAHDPGEWANLGRRSRLLRNGPPSCSDRYGRVRTIVIDPTNPNACMSPSPRAGSGAPRHRRELDPLTESLGTLSVVSLRLIPRVSRFTSASAIPSRNGRLFVKSIDTARRGPRRYLGDSTTISRSCIAVQSSTLFAATDKVSVHRAMRGHGAWCRSRPSDRGPAAWSIESAPAHVGLSHA